MHQFNSLFQNTSGSRCFLCLFLCISERIHRVLCSIGSGWQQTSAWIDGLLSSSLSFSLLTGAFFLSDASWSPAPHGACGDCHIKLTHSVKAVTPLLVAGSLLLLLLISFTICSEHFLQNAGVWSNLTKRTWRAAWSSRWCFCPAVVIESAGSVSTCSHNFNLILD